MDCQRRKVILDVVLPDVPLHLLLQDFQTPDSNERPWETIERDTVDMLGDRKDPRARIDDVRAHNLSYRPTGVLSGQWVVENVIVSSIFDLPLRVVV